MDNAYNINRLQFRHHSEIFTGATLDEARTEAIRYISGATAGIRDAQTGLAVDDDNNFGVGTKYGYSLFSEPTVLRYSEIGKEDDPHIILAIGSVTNDKFNDSGEVWHSNNKFCIIDIDKVESEIEDLWEEIENIIKSLNIITIDSSSLDLDSKWVLGEGVYLSGNVKTAETHVFSGETKTNNLMVSTNASDSPDGLFIYVDLTYDEAAETFSFVASQWDGTLKKTSVKLPNNYLVSGYYSKRDESIHLIMKDGSEVVINCEKLIAEWGVEGDASKTPVVLTKDEVYYDNTDEHHHIEPWQDILRADVRLKDEQKILQPDGTYKYVKDENSINILDRTSDGRYLYVDGKASNIIYYMDGEKTNVKETLDKLVKIKLSTDNDNIIINRPDGFFASAKLEYIKDKNTLVFKTSGQEDKRIELNSVELFENIYYDSTREVLILTYKDSKGETQFVEIPIGEMIRDWEWEVQNEGHNIKLDKRRYIAGNDKLSADAKIYNDPDNILVDKNHELFVKGTADNIKYGDSTVKEALDELNATDRQLEEKIDNEIERATTAENELDGKIGSGFTNDPHDNVTYKFEQLTDRVSAEETRAHDEEVRIETKLNSEIDRSIAKDEEHDGKIETIENEIGEGFGPRNTIRDEFDREKAERENADQALQNEIDAVSADSANSLKDILNVDKSININKTDPIRPVISVNLSEEVEHGKENIIKLNADGLYAGVDLSYEETANKLIFSTTNGSKEIQLESMSSIISIEYNPTKEAIVITYLTNGHEIKTVEIPVGDLINEWRVEDGHPNAIQLEKVRVASGTSEQDVLKAAVVINDDHDDNILVMDDGALYVPGAQIAQNAADIANLKDRMDNAEADIDALEDGLEDEIQRATNVETNLQNAIGVEEARARETETRIETALNNEISRATAKENDLDAEITAETLRAQAADNELYQKIAEETASRISKDAELESLINQETARAQVIETTISERLGAEVNRSTLEDQAIRDLLTAETTSRQEGDAELQQAIQDAKITFSPSLRGLESDGTIMFNDYTTNDNIVEAKVMLDGGDNIIKVGNGLYATATLEYEPTGNKLRLVTSNGAQEYIQLVGATLLDSIEYDSVNKILIIKYTDGTGEQRETAVGVTDLWNDWIVQNPSEKSAVEMTKTIGDPGNPDTISARVLITDDRDGDGKPDEGSDNLIEIRNNGLYVDGSKISGASEEVACVKSELKTIEKAIFGNPVGEECGEGFVYTPYRGACVISGATSLYEADQMLNDQLCRIISMWVSGETCTTKSGWIEEGSNKKMEVNVKVSRGKYGEMSDDDVFINDLSGAYIDPTNHEFTDTNALRIVCLTESSSGITPSVDSKQNGVYLSNAWDCGLYYDDVVDVEAKASAEAAGYNTNYSTDNDPQSMNYNYMNNVR